MNKLAFLFAFVIALAGCQKELRFEKPPVGGAPVENSPGGGSAEGYYMTCKIDGNARRFNNSNAALISDLGTGGKNITFIGLAQPPNLSMEGLHMSVYFLKAGPVTGTFKQDAPTSDYALTGDYNANSLQFGYFAGLHQPSVAPLTITISAISSTVVKGSFSGAFYKKDLNTGPGTSSEYILFTEGTFNLPVR